MSNNSSNRRNFLKSSLGGLSSVAVVGLAPEFSPETGPRHLSARDLVELEADVQPLVRLIERTPRTKCIGVVANEIQRGTSYRTLMAALFLAGITNIKSANTGGPLHAVFVMHSAHQMSLDSAPGEQFLPMFWALDNFKAVQDRGDRLEKMQTFSGRKIAPEKAIKEFELAMESWDPDRAEAAMISMLSNLGSHEIIERMWKYGARDYRAIGHKAIYVANSWRTLSTIGWRHAQPAMRHLARALVAYGAHASGSGFTMDQQSYHENVIRAEKHAANLPNNLIGHLDDVRAVEEVLEAIRNADHDAACDLVINLLASGAAKSGTIWDAVHLSAGEIVMRQATIRPVHGVTSANAIRYAFDQSSIPQTRLLLLLQSVGWMCHFIRYISSLAPPFPKKQINQLSEVDIPSDTTNAVIEIFDMMSGDPDAAAIRAYSLANREDVSNQFQRVARGLIYRKGNESHRYKFPAAAWEDIRLLSPRWRPNFLAASTYYLCGSKLPDSPVMNNIKESLR